MRLTKQQKMQLLGAALTLFTAGVTVGLLCALWAAKVGGLI